MDVFVFQNSNSNGLAFALPGRWTGGKREVRREADTEIFLQARLQNTFFLKCH